MMRTSYNVIPSEVPHCPLFQVTPLLYQQTLGLAFHYHQLSFTTRLSISLFAVFQLLSNFLIIESKTLLSRQKKKEREKKEKRKQT